MNLLLLLLRLCVPSLFDRGVVDIDLDALCADQLPLVLTSWCSRFACAPFCLWQSCLDLDVFVASCPADRCARVCFPTARSLACCKKKKMGVKKGCDCSCYDCKDPACHCAIPNGFCSMLPSFFMIDYVSQSASLLAAESPRGKSCSLCVLLNCRFQQTSRCCGTLQLGRRRLLGS